MYLFRNGVHNFFRLGAFSSVRFFSLGPTQQMPLEGDVLKYHEIHFPL
jgi:hypothetical protein